MIQFDRRRNSIAKERVANDGHFIDELAENDELMSVSFLFTDDAFESVYLSRVSIPVMVVVSARFSSFSVDVNLWMNGHLTKTNEKEKLLSGVEKVSFEHLKKVLVVALDAAIELFFIGRNEGKYNMLYVRDRRCGRNDIADLVKRTVYNEKWE